MGYSFGLATDIVLSGDAVLLLDIKDFRVILIIPVLMFLSFIT